MERYELEIEFKNTVMTLVATDYFADHDGWFEVTEFHFENYRGWKIKFDPREENRIFKHFQADMEDKIIKAISD